VRQAEMIMGQHPATRGTTGIYDVVHWDTVSIAT
jgi:hypothetical protein